MNYFEHHIGDFLKKTIGLSMLAEGAYRRLLDCYYIEEKPLPANKKEVYELARTRSKADRDAVDLILEKFFELGPDGYFNSRCDEEIQRYLASEPEREAKKEQERERQRRSRERRKELFEQLREYGIVPPYNTTTADLQAHLSRVTNSGQSHESHAPVTRDNTATHTHFPLPNKDQDQKTIAETDKSVTAPRAPKAKFNYSTNQFENLSAEMLGVWREAYLATDVRQEIAKAKAWLIANPKNRKSNIERFLTNWLTKAQDNAPRLQHEINQSTSRKPDTSVAGEIRANVARELAARSNSSSVAADGLDVRPQVGEQLRTGSGPGQRVGLVLEGDFTRADQTRAEPLCD